MQVIAFSAAGEWSGTKGGFIPLLFGVKGKRQDDSAVGVKDLNAVKRSWTAGTLPMNASLEHSYPLRYAPPLRSFAPATFDKRNSFVQG